MLRPTLRGVLLQTAVLPFAAAPAMFGGHWWPLWLCASLAALFALLIDALFTIRPKDILHHTNCPAALYIGGENPPLNLQISAPGAARGFVIEARVEFDGRLAYPPDARAHVPPGKIINITFPLAPARRGEARLRSIWLRWTGPLRLVQRDERRFDKIKISIIPNIASVRRAAIRYFSAKEFLAGLKVERYLGDGSEFESIREFVPGFDLRSLDWKASARHRKLLCREFRAERNHQIILGFDTGRLMGEPIGGTAKLDLAMNAALLLAYVCLRTGDRVGTFAFDDRVRMFTKPAGGIVSFQKIQLATAELEYSTAETNFTLALTDLRARLNRRSLIILFTDFVDSITAELMVENVGRLARRHLVICVTPRDPRLLTMAAAPPDARLDWYRSMAAADLLKERERVLQRLRRIGVHCLDARAEHVSSDLLNHYLEIKRRELV